MTQAKDIDEIIDVYFISLFKDVYLFIWSFYLNSL